MTSDLKDKIEAILMSHPKWMSVKYAYNIEDEIVIKLSDLFEAELAQAVKKAKLEAYREFYVKVDEKFGSYKIDEAMGEVLKELIGELAQPEEEK